MKFSSEKILTDMRGMSDDYFDKFSDKPVKIVRFNPKSRIVAGKYIKKIRSLLKNFEIEILHRGSTAFGIVGKGEIEVGVYLLEKDWEEVVETLKTHFGKVDNLEDNYARFNDFFDGFEIEIILLKGSDAVVDKKLNEYLKNSPEILKVYENLKNKYSYSKKEYMIQKNKFLEEIVKNLN